MVEASQPITRRQFLKGAALVAAGAVAGACTTWALLPTWKPRDQTVATSQPPSPIMIKADAGHRYLTLDDLAGAAPTFVLAEWVVPVLVLKLDQGLLRASAVARGYNTAQHAVQHPTEPENALIVYDARCTHLGCSVGFNLALGASSDIEDYADQGKKDGRIMCPCHQAQFDVYDLAKNRPGTPAPRPLDVIPIRIGPWTNDDTVNLVTVDQAILGLGRIHQTAYRTADLQGAGAGFGLSG